MRTAAVVLGHEQRRPAELGAALPVVPVEAGRVVAAPTQLVDRRELGEELRGRLAEELLVGGLGSSSISRPCVIDVNTGSVSQPRTVDVRACLALSQSTSHSGKRCSTSSSATRPSRRASAAPRQKWMP